MPSLGADMEAGTLVQWLKHPGDMLKRGDIIAVVDTQKGAIEIEVFEDGTLEQILVQPGQLVPVGTPLAILRGEAKAASPSVAAEALAAAPLPAKPSAAVPPTPAATDQRQRISPAARKAAQQLQVDLSSLAGSGEGGAVTVADVERAAAAAAEPVTAAPAAKAPSGMRQAIAAAMARSKREIPHFYLSATIDATRAQQWLVEQNRQRPVPARLLFVVMLLKAVGRALRDVPGLNGYWIDDAFRPADRVHVGCAITLRDGGLVAPALHDTDGKNLDTLMRELQDLVRRVRSGTLRSSELTDSTITVTNLGELGVEEAFGIIYPPQVTLVGFGRVAERPWVVDGGVKPRQLLTATVSVDHRAVDGHRAGRFLASVDRWLQEPEAL
jgi:pyruvate dehydrogenase E2 component (dihydrolipoamide acetyltransferase)